MALIENGRFIKPTLQQLEAKALEYVRAEFGEDAEVAPEDFLGMYYRLVAQLSLEHVERLEDGYFSFFYNTASGQQLDDIFYPSLRVSGIKAQGEISLVWTLETTQEYTLISGTQFTSNDGQVYETQEDITIPVGTTEFEIVITADETGLNGNLPSGVDFSSGFSFTEPPESIQNASAIIGGRDRETDEEYRIRLLRSSSGLISNVVEESLLTIPGVDHARIYINADTAQDENLVPAHGYEIVVRAIPQSDALDQIVAETIAQSIEPWVARKTVSAVQREVLAENGVGYQYYFTRAVAIASADIQVSYSLVVGDGVYIDEYDDIIKKRVIEYMGGVFTSSDNVVEDFEGLVGIGGRLTLPSLQGLIFELETSTRISGVYTISDVTVAISGESVTGVNSTYKLARNNFLSLTNEDITITKTVVSEAPSP